MHKACRGRGLQFATGVAVAFAAGVGALAFAARRANMSMSLLLTRSVLGLLPKTLGSPDQIRHEVQHRAYPRDAPISASLCRLCEVEERDVEGQKFITLTPRKQRTNRHILYLHGGAYVHPMISAHWKIIRALIGTTGASVTVPLYALAPENDHRAATEFVDRVYGHIEEHRPSERIVVAGDSAGGNFALTLAIRRRDAGLPLPHCLVLFSPWLDLTSRNERAKELESLDVMLSVDCLRLCGRWWAGEADPASPHMSPLYAKLEGLPPIALFQGDHDIFVADARTFVGQARAAGLECRYREYAGAFHVFMGATHTPEARDVFRRTASFISARPPSEI